MVAAGELCCLSDNSGYRFVLWWEVFSRSKGGIVLLGIELEKHCTSFLRRDAVKKNAIISY